MSTVGVYSTLFNDMPDDIEILYHFTSKEVALEKILSSGQLRFNKLGMTNDPRETKYWLFDYEYSYNDFGKTYPDTNDYINNLLKLHSNVLCFSVDNLSFDVDHNKRNGYMHSRSWAQYASNHCGICLLFDKRKLIDSINHKYSSTYMVWHDIVRYKNRLEIDRNNHLKIATKIINEQSLMDHIFKYKDEFFFEKRLDWSDENEYRVMLYSTELVKDYLYIDIVDSIKGIIVGVDFNDVYIPCISQFCKKYKIKADRVQWSEGNPVLCCPIYY